MEIFNDPVSRFPILSVHTELAGVGGERKIHPHLPFTKEGESTNCCAYALGQPEGCGLLRAAFGGHSQRQLANCAYPFPRLMETAASTMNATAKAARTPISLPTSTRSLPCCISARIPSTP